MKVVPLLLLALLVTATLPAAETAPTESDPVAEDLRQLDPPWYDAEEEGWRQVEIESEERSTGDGIEVDPGTATGLGLVVQMLLTGLIVALLAALLYWIVRQLQTQSTEVPQINTGCERARVDISVLPFSQAIEGDPEAGLAAAIERGDWRLAVIYLYACQLFYLDRRGLIHLHPGKTNRRYLREIPPERPSLRRDLKATVGVFERVYFGGQDIGRAEFERLHARDRDLRTAGAESRP